MLHVVDGARGGGDQEVFCELFGYSAGCYSMVLVLVLRDRVVVVSLEIGTEDAPAEGEWLGFRHHFFGIVRTMNRRRGAREQTIYIYIFP